MLVPFSVADAIVQDGDADAVGDVGNQEEEADVKSELGGWRLALEAPFDQIERYNRYVRGLSQFDTHQGLMGLEFPRVWLSLATMKRVASCSPMTSFSRSRRRVRQGTDNEAAGKETSIDRTRRLFYVTCSRAEQSLAVVYFAADPTLARDAMIRQEWFEPGEIELMV